MALKYFISPTEEETGESDLPENKSKTCSRDSTLRKKKLYMGT